MEISPKGRDTISTAKQVSTPKEPQIHAQNGKSGGSGDSGDIFGHLVRIVINRPTLTLNNISNKLF